MSTLFDTANLLRLNRLIGSNRLKFLGIYLAEVFHVRHTIVRFDPISACNLRCQMCYFSDESWREANRGKFSDEEITWIAQEFFPRALQVYIGCSMEPTLYKGFPKLIKTARDFKVPFVGMISNGQLITKTHLEEMLSYGLDELTLSTHGVKAETYERMMPGAKFETFQQLLQNLVEVKRGLGVDNPTVRLNYTVNPDNLEELSDFFSAYGSANIGVLQVRPIIDLGDVTYQRKDLGPFLQRYNEIIGILERECKARSIRLLCNRWDPTYHNPNSSAPVYTQGVVRFVRPGKVWREDFQLLRESYADYVKRSKFRQRMLGYALGLKKVPVEATAFASSEVL